MKLADEIESLRRAILAEEFSTVQHGWPNLSSALAELLDTPGITTENIRAVEKELTEFHDWARSALRSARSHIEYRITNAAAAGAYHAQTRPRDIAVKLDG